MISKIRSILLAMLVVVQILYLTIKRSVNGGVTFPGYTQYTYTHPHPLRGATYYVDYTTGNDNDSGLTEELAWKTVAKVNASTFSANDSILFKRGETWREGLGTTSSGIPDHPITFGAYGTGARPTFDGADILNSGWEQYSGNIYRRGATNDPERIWWGDTELTGNEGNYATLGTYEADWDTGYLYVNIRKSPNGEQMNVPVREWGVNLQYKSYVTYVGLHFTHSFGNGITQGASVSGSNIVFDDCVSDYNGANGMCYGVTTARGTYFSIQNSQFNYNGTSNLYHGIYEEAGTSWTIQNSVFIGNAGWGIQIQDDSDSNIVRYNYFEDNVTGAIVIYDNGAGGCSYNEIYYNIINSGYDGIWFGGSNLNTNNEVYNNAMYGFAGSGFKITHDSQ